MGLMFMGPSIVIIFWYIIPTRCTSHRVYLIWQLLYMFRASLSPIFRSTKQLHLQHLVTITPYCCLLLSWKSWNWFECAVDGVRHPQHTQISSNSSTIATDNIYIFNMVRPCSENGRRKITQNSIAANAETKEGTRKTEEKLDERYKEDHERKKPIGRPVGG